MIGPRIALGAPALQRGVITAGTLTSRGWELSASPEWMFSENRYLILSSGEYRSTPPTGTGTPSRIPYARAEERVLITLGGATSQDGTVTDQPDQLVDVQIVYAPDGQAGRSVSAAGANVRLSLYSGENAGGLILTSRATDIEFVPLSTFKDGGGASASSGGTDGFTGRDQIGLSENWHLERIRMVPRDRVTGAYLRVVEPGVYAPLDWSYGLLEARELEFTHSLDLDLGVMQITTSAPRAGRTTRAWGGGSPVTRTFPTAEGSITVEFPVANLTQLTPHSVLLHNARMNGGLVSWQPGGELAGYDLRVYAGTTLLTSSTNRLGTVTFSGATHATLTVSSRTQTATRLESIEFSTEIDVPVRTPASPAVAGAPEREADGFAFTARVQALTGPVRRHPTMTPLQTIQLEGPGQLVWRGPEWFEVRPSRNARIFWTPGNGTNPRGTEPTASEIERAAPRAQQYSDVRRPVVTTQTYRPQVRVYVTALNEPPVEITPDVTQLSSNQCVMTGSSAPDLDARISQEGSRLSIWVDGQPAQHARIVAARKSPFPGGRTFTLEYANPLDFHNVDLEYLNRNEDGTSSRANPATEYQYLQTAATKSGLGPIALDPDVFMRNTGYWTASLASGGYGGLDDDYASAYGGQGGTVAQEIETVANANLAVSTATADGVKLVPMIPNPQLSLPEIAQLAVDSNAVLNADRGAYLPDAKLSTSDLGYNLMNGYAVMEVSGQSNVLETPTIKGLLTVYNQSNRETTSALEILHNTGVAEIRISSGDYDSEEGPYFFGSLEDGVPQAKAYPVRMNMSNPSQIDALYPGWQNPVSGVPTKQDDYTTMQHLKPPRTASPVGRWLVPASTDGMPEITNTKDAQGKTVDPLRRYYVNSKLFYSRAPEGEYTTNSDLYIKEVLYIVDSPARIRANGSATEFFDDSFGPCVTGVFLRLHDGAVGFTALFTLVMSMTMPDVASLRIKPYTREFDAEYAPAWYSEFVDEARRSSASRPQKKNTLQNPLVVEHLPGNFPDRPGVSFEYPVPATLPGVTGLNYQHASHVATGVGLLDWLRTRSATATYVGAPSWQTGQFLVTARRPPGGVGKTVRQFDVFLIMTAPDMEIIPGESITSQVQLGYVGTTGLRGVVSRNPTRVTPFEEDPLPESEGVQST